MLDLLSRLEGVKMHSDAHGIALCPAHDDKRRPSLSFRDDGAKWLLNCFAGCTALEVCDALGLEYRELFHDGQIKGLWRDGRQRANPRDALESLEHEALVVQLIAEELAEGRMSDTSQERVLLAAQRIMRARELCRS